MKGIILAGGTGSRLSPLTKIINKHLLPVGKYPMIFYPLFKLKQAEIKDILIITGRDHMGDFGKLLGSGHDFGLNLTYRVQDQPGGIAHALKLARDFVNSDLMTVILGDNIFSADISPFVKSFIRQKLGAKILLKKVSDPERYGVAELEGEKILSIEEKPSVPKSLYAVTGIYMYDSSVFEIIDDLIPSKRGELEITDVNKAYLDKQNLSYDILPGWWTDAGTFDSLSQATALAKDITINFLQS